MEHSDVGDEFEKAIPGLFRSAIELLKGPPISIDLPQAEHLLEQFRETANHRQWILHAVSVMYNHIHLVVESPPEIGKLILLRDFKSYGARRLNRHYGKPLSETWWTQSGSCRPVKNLPAAIFYTCRRQPNPLVVWSRDRGRIPPGESHPDNVFPVHAGEPPA